jgi:hypothetical protein
MWCIFEAMVQTKGFCGEVKVKLLYALYSLLVILLYFICICTYAWNYIQLYTKYEIDIDIKANPTQWFFMLELLIIIG